MRGLETSDNLPLAVEVGARGEALRRLHENPLFEYQITSYIG